jgi:hypothetical protein
MNTQEFNRPLKFSIKPSPKRLFLREALEQVLQNPTKMPSSICVMGIVSTEPKQQDPHSEYCTFVLDDGTASINVVYPSDIISNIEIPPGMPHLKSFVLGDEIECFGTIATQAQGIHNKDDDNGDDNPNTQSSFTLILNSFALVQDKNLSSLRMVELSRKPCNGVVDSPCDSRALVYMYGDIMKKLQHISYTENGTITLNRTHIFRLIQQSKSEDGITEEDIALLLGLKSEQERVVLKITLEEMQSNCEIYQSKTFSYLPL